MSLSKWTEGDKLQWKQSYHLIIRETWTVRSSLRVIDTADLPSLCVPVVESDGVIDDAAFGTRKPLVKHVDWRPSSKRRRIVEPRTLPTPRLARPCSTVTTHPGKWNIMKCVDFNSNIEDFGQTWQFLTYCVETRIVLEWLPKAGILQRKELVRSRQ